MKRLLQLPGVLSRRQDALVRLLCIVCVLGSALHLNQASAQHVTADRGLRPGDDRQDARQLQIEDAVARAQQAQAAGDYAGAAKAYEDAVNLDRLTAELWANRGVMQHLAGDYAGSAKSLHQAIALKPALYVPYLFLGLDELELGKDELAVEHLRHAVALAPSDAQVQEALGRAYLALGRPNKAVAAYQVATAIDADNKTTWFGLGTAAIATIEQDGGHLASSFPESPWARALYADELLKQGRTTEAVDIYRTLGRQSSPVERAVFATTLEASRKAAEERGDAITPAAWDSVLDALTRGGEAPLKPLPCSAQRASRSSPKADANLEMACLYWESQAQAVAKIAGKRLAANIADPEALFWGVKANERLAVEALTRFEQLAPQSAATFDVLGDLYRRREQPDSALEEYAKALAIDRRDPGALLGRAAALLALGQMEDAITAAENALTASPSDPRLNLILGEALVDRHRFQEAEPPLRVALATIAKQGGANPVVAALAAHGHALLGRSLAATGDAEGAIAEMKLGESSDTDGSISYQLSRLYLRQGNLQEARKAEAKTRELQAKRRQHAATAIAESPPANP